MSWATSVAINQQETVTKKSAGKLFFEKENNKSFYYKESIGEKIREQYSKELSDTIIPGCLKSSRTWWISSPVFIKKVRQRIYWTTTIEPEFEIYHYERDGTHQNAPSSPRESLRPPPTNKVPVLSHPATYVPPLPPLQTALGQGLIGSALQQKKVIDLTGKEKFEVHWSANLSPAQNLTAPKLEKIEYLGNNLAEL